MLRSRMRFCSAARRLHLSSASCQRWRQRPLIAAVAVESFRPHSEHQPGPDSDGTSVRRRRLTWSQLRDDGGNGQNLLKLPRLPVPSLGDTLERYEQSLQGLDFSSDAKHATCDAVDVSKHVAAMRSFLHGPTGQRLQQQLVDQGGGSNGAPAYPHTFIEREWDGMYLCHRGPSAPMTVPAIALPRSAAPAETAQCMDQQCHTAARWVHGLLRFAHKLVHEGMDVDPARPFDFHAMTKQFGFARIPVQAAAADDGGNSDCSSSLNVSSAASQGADAVRDELALAPLEEVAMGHIVVLHKGFVYRVATRVASEKGAGRRPSYASPELLAESLAGIVAGCDAAVDSHGGSEPFPVGALTGVGRDTWARVRADLARDPANAAMLRTIDEALIVVCLDTAVWDKKQEDTNGADGILRGMLGGIDHGNGHGGVDVVSRWYDKHMLLVDASGRAAFCFEHSFSDGMVWSRWIDEVFQDLVDPGNAAKTAYTPLPSLPSPPASTAEATAPPVERLDFRLGDADKAEIVAAVDAVRDQVTGITHAAVAIPFGKSQIAAELRVSPDAFCQAAFLLAFYRLHEGQMAATYESCSTGTFFHGRTETIRTATKEMRALCHAFSSSSSSDNDDDDGAESQSKEQRLYLLREASKRHVALAREASAGQGIDRHLLALQMAARRGGEAEEEDGVSEAAAAADEARRVFSDPVFVRSSERWMMTTSNISKPFVDWFNFCPVQPDGYGLGYTIHSNAIRVAVSSYAASDVSSARGLANAVHAAALDLADLRPFL